MNIFVGFFTASIVLTVSVDIVHGYQKKGVAVGPRNFLCDDFKAMDNMLWWYDWGVNLDTIRSRCPNIYQHIDTFVPMIWGHGKHFSNISIYSQATFILGFNEPNHFEQANLTPEKAASYWPAIEKKSGGKPLVSPATAPCGGSKCYGNTTEWLDKFFQLCKGCRVDFLATHKYSCNATVTMAFLKRLYVRYGLKIWLTEFACPHTTDAQKQLTYMKQILPLLEDAHFVYRYSWFVSRIVPQPVDKFITASASLLEPYTSTLTTLGRFYNSFDRKIHNN